MSTFETKLALFLREREREREIVEWVNLIFSVDLDFAIVIAVIFACSFEFGKEPARRFAPFAKFLMY